MYKIFIFIVLIIISLYFYQKKSNESFQIARYGRGHKSPHDLLHVNQLEKNPNFIQEPFDTSNEQFQDLRSKLYEASSPQFVGKDYQRKKDYPLLSRIPQISPIIQSKFLRDGLGYGSQNEQDNAYSLQLSDDSYSSQFLTLPATESQKSRTKFDLSPSYLRPGITSVGSYPKKKHTFFKRNIKTPSEYESHIQNNLPFAYQNCPYSNSSKCSSKMHAPDAQFKTARNSASAAYSMDKKFARKTQMLPQQMLPQQMLPQQMLPQQILPQQMLPQQMLPQQMLPQQMLPQQMLPQQMLPQQMLHTEQPIYYPAGTPGTVVLYNNQAVPIIQTPMSSNQNTPMFIDPSETVIGSLVNYVDQMYMPLYMKESPYEDGYIFYTKTVDDPLNIIPIYLNGKNCLDFGGCNDLLDGYNVYIPQFDRNFIVKIGSEQFNTKFII